MSYMDYWKTVLDRDIEQHLCKNETEAKYVTKNDKGKPRLDLVPLDIVDAIGEVMTEALKVYTENSWKTVEKHRFIAATMRHWNKYKEDNKSINEDTGLPHLWHAAANIAFLVNFENRKENVNE